MTTKRKKKVREVATMLLSQEVYRMYWEKIVKRCLYEGCRYANGPKEPLMDNCIYCGKERPKQPANYGIGILEKILTPPRKKTRL